MDQVFSEANDQFSEPEKLEAGLVKSAGPQLQPPDILLSGHLHVSDILPHSHPHTEAPGAWPLS